MFYIKYILALIFLLLSGCNAQTDWTSYRGKNGSGSTSDAIFPPIGIRWKMRLQNEGASKSFNPPVIKGDILYFGSDDGNFYALNAKTGFMKWIFPTKQSVNSVPFVDETNVYFGSNDGRVYAVNQETGKEVWNFPTGNTVQSLVTRYKDTIIVTSDTGSTFFLAIDGTLKHRIPNPVWSHHTFQVYEDVVYWAPLGRRFGAYDINKKEFLWTVDVDVPYPVWYSFPALDSENVYFASSYFTGQGVQLHFTALNRLTGQEVWTYEDEMDIGTRVTFDQENLFLRHIELLDYMAPSLWNNLVIFTSGDTVVRAFEAKTGKIAWRKTFSHPTSSAPTVAGDRIYFGLRGDEGGHSGLFGEEEPQLVCIAAKNGDVLWKTPTEGAVLNSPVISGKRILFGTDARLFYVLEEIF